MLTIFVSSSMATKFKMLPWTEEQHKFVTPDASSKGAGTIKKKQNIGCMRPKHNQMFDVDRIVEHRAYFVFIWDR